MAPQRIPERSVVEEVAPNEGSPGLDLVGVTGGEIVLDDGGVTLAQELLGDDAANIARAAGHENPHAELDGIIGRSGLKSERWQRSE